nr:DUF262 domain-containing protein [Vibrio diabolicus]
MKPSDYLDFEKKSPKFFYDGVKNGTLLIDNSFQRRGVWVEKDKVGLIESILLGFPIPELYLWETGVSDDPEQAGELTYSIVDGQQRITAVWEFINNKFPLKKSYLEFGDAEYAGKTFSEILALGYKDDFWLYKFHVRTIKQGLGINEIKKMFLRLNKTNTSLNPQELRNAEFNGLFIKLADELSANCFWEKYKVFTKNDLRRMNDIQVISTLLMFFRQGISDTGQSAINKIYDTYNDRYDESKEDYKLFCDVLEVMDTMAEIQENLSGQYKVKVHFYTLFIISYFILIEEKTNDLERIANELSVWYAKYENKEYEDEGKFKHLEEYAVLSQEGSGKKFNRTRRISILKSYLFS